MDIASLLPLLLLASNPDLDSGTPLNPAELRSAIEDGIRTAIVGPVAEAIRLSKLPPFLTRQQLSDLTGWSLRKVDYVRKEQRRLPYIRRGRTVLFRTSDVMAHFDEALVNAKEPFDALA